MFIVKINIYILFFFLENNVILIGISVIVDLFVEDFIFFNKVDKLEILLFDKKMGVLVLKKVREYVEFLIVLFLRRDEMFDLLKILEVNDRSLIV